MIIWVMFDDVIAVLGVQCSAHVSRECVSVYVPRPHALSLFLHTFFARQTFIANVFHFGVALNSYSFSFRNSHAKHFPNSRETQMTRINIFISHIKHINGENQHSFFFGFTRYGVAPGPDMSTVIMLLFSTESGL